MTADTATRHKSACILCENNRGIQIQTDARRFAKIRGAEEHVAAVGYTLIGRTVPGRQVVQPEPLLRR
ncbi:hypothetical protein [Streptomyces ossamyceticus]|jgi:hypothetical protein|uniref:Uncharacterized protein n=1 Tax=Streptomyces ossamyceticus TaxID=249581 RepID=A0ABV2VAZ7_9ACTN